MDLKFPREERYPADKIEAGVYSAVVVDFLDRSTGRVTRQLCYPVVRIALVNDPEDFDSARVFTVTGGAPDEWATWKGEDS